MKDTIKLSEKQTITMIANIAHHGALLGYGDKISSMNEIRRLTLSWWDKEDDPNRVKASKIQPKTENPIGLKAKLLKEVDDLQDTYDNCDIENILKQIKLTNIVLKNQILMDQESIH